MQAVLAAHSLYFSGLFFPDERRKKRKVLVEGEEVFELDHVVPADFELFLKVGYRDLF